MELWQEKLCKESYTRNFYKDKETINKVFEELCQPIINVDGKGECKYENGINNDADAPMSKLTIKKTEVYELLIFKDFLKLCFGYECNDRSGEKTIKPVCLIEYRVEDGEETYTIEVKDKKVYGKKISHEFELAEIKPLYKDKEFKLFESNEDTYRMIITNIMNIAVTGTLEGEKLFEKKQKISAKDLGL